ncbi:MAG: class I SAM-dependent methyltransferase [Syntrophobacterales bacterium]|nr:MAG: class I SAM-dependent methyltransferase [Syntrophobacterales bacterium]
MEHLSLFRNAPLPGPILDLACGDGHNGIILAQNHLSVICCDKSREALDRARRLAAEHGVTIELWQVDLEREGINPLPEDFYGGILVFRYLHRPLIPSVKKALRTGGILIYETFTVEQPRFGKPHNPDFLLKPGELRAWFADWPIIHSFEGIKENPKRALSQIVCRKTEEGSVAP